MALQIVWFFLIAILFTGFFVLEGFDYGVGILLPFIGKSDTERRQVLNSIGPFWDGNEVWLITAGGALFAAFPAWYATLFSSFYPIMFFIVLALILRGAAFEFRSLHENSRWRTTWDWLIFVGSTLPGLLWGIILANMLKGMPIDARLNYVGGFWNLLNPFALACGLTMTVLFALHGAIFLSLRTSDPLMTRAQQLAQRLYLPAVLLIFLVAISGFTSTNIFQRLLLDPKMVPLGYLLLAALVFTSFFLVRRRNGWAFIMTTLTIVITAIIVGVGLFPNLMISSLNPAWNLTIENASSSPYTLTVITWIGVSCIPVVLLYQGWNYWVFRKRLSPQVVGHY